jgi:basic membrane lipoprotein Med (substrate-binding protein (PBP1-ABC) superfamily)
VKKTDVGVEMAVKDAAKGHFPGGTDIVLNVKNNGVGVGKISPKVPKAWITLMDQYKSKIIAGTIKPPATLGK